MEKQITTARITNLTELEEFCKAVRESTDGLHGDVVYLETDLRLTLIKERLTDGSHVYNIQPALVLARNHHRSRG